MRADSGTCNVCSALCSSCLHFNRALMGLKSDENSGETCQRNAGSQYSVNDVVPVKSNACDNGQSTASEASNTFSVHSSYESFSENAESKVSLRICDVSGAFENVETHPNLSAGGTSLNDQLPLKAVYACDHTALRNKSEHQNGLEDRLVSDSNKGVLSASYTSGRTDDGGLIGGISRALDDVCLILEAETDRDSRGGNLATEAVNSSEVDEKVKESCGLPGVQETSLQFPPVDDSDESELSEHDVKVCDICGDAGREDLLAICCRCTDGAEHTYCMRERRDKVPEGDWLCEECKFDGDAKYQKQDKIVTLDGNDKNQPSGLASALDTSIFVKLNKKDSDVESNKITKDILSTKASGRRHVENFEVTSTTKWQALEPTVGSPKTSSPSRLAALSRDSSFRNLNKGKMIPPGTLLKSNSFHSTDAKPKVELVDEVVHQKQKSAREPASLDTKDGGVRLIGKSMSFKSVYPGRLNPSESKVKMLSPNFSHSQDVKGIKQAKERNLLERKNSFRSERPLVSSATGNKPKGESYSLPSESNKPKGELPDSKISTLSKSASQVSRRDSETPVNLGEIKRLSCSPSSAGASLINGISSSVEENQNQTRLMDDSLSSTSTSERPFGAVDASAARISREVTNKDNKLKAAIEAAMLKKPGICRKNLTDKSLDLSTSSTILDCEPRSQDQLSTSFKMRNAFSANEVHEGHGVLPNSTADSCNGLKQVFPPPSEVVSLKTGDISPIVPSDGEPLIRDLPSHASAAMSVLLKMSAIPEHEYTWQGCFEMYNSGEPPELRDGIQAHLSTCASPKVLEVANKFPSTILLKEVPRLSMWPIQFKETGVKEDDIALYFFAKDLESYEKSYKSLTDNMMKRDLALKGNFDGVELLIFPSNHLPKKSQRWNMLYFLWGVFRGKTVNCLQNVSGTPKEYIIPRDIPTAIMSSPENICSLGPIEGDLPTCSNACNLALVSECPASVEQPSLSSATVNGDSDTKASSIDPKGEFSPANVWGQDCRTDDTSFSMGQCTNALSFEETRCTRTPLEEDVGRPKCELDVNVQPSDQATGTISGSKKSDKRPLSLDEGFATSKKQKTGFTGLYGDTTSSSRVTFVSGMYDLNTSSQTEERCEAGSCDEREILHKDDGTPEMYFFPVDPHPVKDIISTFSSGEKHDRVADAAPSLELALGAEMKPPSEREILPFLGGKVKPTENTATKEEEEEDVSACLSLSLSFPFPVEEKAVKRVSEVEQLLPLDRQQVNTSLLLFDSLSDK